MSEKYPQAGFQEGNTLGVGNGRKGFDLEQEDLERMRRVLRKDVIWLEEMQEKRRNGEKIDSNTLELMKITASRVNKYLDKLHASKQDVTSDGKSIVINVAKEIAQQNDLTDENKIV